MGWVDRLLGTPIPVRMRPQDAPKPKHAAKKPPPEKGKAGKGK